MNCLTKTGLLPSVQNTSYETPLFEQNVIAFENIVTPAPFGLRPFSQYYNPYTNGCSILCNHPVDQEAKQTIKKAKEILERKCIITQKGDITLEDNIDDVFVPEILFRRYTETDSRPQTPTPTVTSITSRLSLARRCITPEPCTTEPEKMQLILDLRRSLSQTAMDISSGIEGHVLSSTALPTAVSFKLPTNYEKGSKHRGHVLEFGSQENNFFTKKKQKFNDFCKDKGACDFPIINASLSDKKEKSPIHKKKKKKPKVKSTKRNTDKEFKDLKEPDETQVSAYDGMGEDDSNAGENTGLSMNENPNTEETSALDLYPIDEGVLKHLQRELTSEVLDNEFDPQKKKVLEEIYARANLTRRSSAVNDQIKSLKHELRLNSLITGSEPIFNLPRTFSRKNARFELPMSRQCLRNMTPLEYVRSYVYVTNESHFVYNEVFKIKLDSNFSELRLLVGQKIMQALTQVMGRDFSAEEHSYFSNILELKDDLQIDFRTWCGICALCERILGEKFAQKYLSKEEDPCYEVEYVDFKLLEKKLHNLDINHNLKELLYKIRDS